MSEPSAPQPPPTPHAAGGSGVQVPASLRERTEINNQLTRACVEAYLAKDRGLLKLRQLEQDVFLLACTIDDLEREPASDRLREDLPNLRGGLAALSAALQQQQQEQQQEQQQQAAPAGQGTAH